MTLLFDCRVALTITLLLDCYALLTITLLSDCYTALAMTYGQDFWAECEVTPLSVLTRFPAFHAVIDFFEYPDALIHLLSGMIRRNREP